MLFRRKTRQRLSIQSPRRDDQGATHLVAVCTLPPAQPAALALQDLARQASIREHDMQWEDVVHPDREHRLQGRLHALADRDHSVEGELQARPDLQAIASTQDQTMEAQFADTGLRECCSATTWTRTTPSCGVQIQPSASPLGLSNISLISLAPRIWQLPIRPVATRGILSAWADLQAAAL
jgi:hypothetical protein